MNSQPSDASSSGDKSQTVKGIYPLAFGNVETNQIHFICNCYGASPPFNYPFGPLPILPLVQQYHSAYFSLDRLKWDYSEPSLASL